MQATRSGKRLALLDDLRREKAVALSFPELINSLRAGSDSSDSSSQEDRHILNLSNDSTYYGDDEYLSSIIGFAEGSSASVVSSLVIPPHDGSSDVESVYTTSSSGSAKPPNLVKVNDDAPVSLSLTFCGTTNQDETALASRYIKTQMPQDSFHLVLWEKILLGVVVLALLLCCGITAIVIFRFRSTELGFIASHPPESSLTNFTIVPSFPPSNEDRFNLIRKFVGAGGGNIFEKNPAIGTPQYNALTWMADVDAPNILGEINYSVLARSDDLLTRLTQRYALLVIFFAIIGSENLALGGWASITGARLPECIWPGVSCRSMDGSNDATVVVGLHLDPTIARVHGSLPTEVGLLSNLESLKLMDTLLTGDVPSNIFSLSKLHTLRISNSTLSTTLSTNIGKLSNLVFLEFTQNEFTDTLPTEVGFLTELQFLNLAHNAFSGFIPSEIGQMQQLRKLSFQDNEWNGALPGEICLLMSTHRLEYVSADCLVPFHQQNKVSSLPRVSCDCCTVCF